MRHPSQLTSFPATPPRMQRRHTKNGSLIEFIDPDLRHHTLGPDVLWLGAVRIGCDGCLNVEPKLGMQKSGRVFEKSTEMPYFFSIANRYSSQNPELNVVWNSSTNFPSRSTKPSAQRSRTSKLKGLPTLRGIGNWGAIARWQRWDRREARVSQAVPDIKFQF
jgi:hypothetical protein